MNPKIGLQYPHSSRPHTPHSQIHPSIHQFILAGTLGIQYVPRFWDHDYSQKVLTCSCWTPVITLSWVASLLSSNRNITYTTVAWLSIWAWELYREENGEISHCDKHVYRDINGKILRDKSRDKAMIRRLNARESGWCPKKNLAQRPTCLNKYTR